MKTWGWGRCSGQGTRTSMYGSCILSAAHPQITWGLTADPMLCNGLLPAVDRLSHASRKTEPLTQDLKRTVPFSEHPNFEFGTISDPLYIVPHVAIAWLGASEGEAQHTYGRIAEIAMLEEPSIDCVPPVFYFLFLFLLLRAYP